MEIDLAHFAVGFLIGIFIAMVASLRAIVWLERRPRPTP